MDKLLNEETLFSFVDVARGQKRVPVVFVLDTSNSMRGEGFAQMKKAFVSIIQEYSNQPIVDHFVAVISFGTEIKVLQHYSNDYKAILHILDDILCKGPSQLGKALQLALSVFLSGMIGFLIGPFSISAKLVIISSGNVSSNNRAEHSEDCRYEKMNIVRMVEQTCKKKPIICVPVGSSPDMCFLGSIAYASKNGKLLNVDEAAQYGRYSTNMVIASEIIGSVPTTDYTVNDVRAAVQTRRGSQITTEKDIEDIYEILTNRHAYEMNSYQMEDSIESELHLEGDPRLPPIGTRVRKGHNWPFLYTGQDSNLCGTVIGHRDGHLNISVEWDTGMIFPYHFDTNGDHHQSNVVVCDEPRILQREKIAVGCLVERGPDWKWLDQDGGKNNIGSVYRVNKNNTVHVRWPNGTKSNYRFGYDGKYDVSLCDPFDNNIMRTFKERQSGWHKKNSKKVASNDGIINKDWTVKVTSLSAKSFDTDSRKKSGNQVKTCENITEKKTSDEAVINSPTIQNKNGSSGRHLNTDSNTSPQSSFWEWKTKQGRWISFPKSENEKIQNAFKKNRKGTVLVNINEDLYRVVLSKMIQINISNRESHEIRRLC